VEAVREKEVKLRGIGLNATFDFIAKTATMLNVHLTKSKQIEHV